MGTESLKEFAVKFKTGKRFKLKKPYPAVASYHYCQLNLDNLQSFIKYYDFTWLDYRKNKKVRELLIL
jgi:hypothetical protein